MSKYKATKASVLNRGVPPDDFLDELVQFGQSADSEIFVPNPNPADIYALIKSRLATQGVDGSFTWDESLHRRAAMLEAMRVHAGFESSWNWDEGVDMTNMGSQANIKGQETGIFQVSFDSLYLDHTGFLDACLRFHIGADYSVRAFIDAMKRNHFLALEYYARLVRISIAWAGPLVRHEILPMLSRPAMVEFMGLLKG